ncbi:MAG: hypothetical protein AAGN46_04790 [Acidobacteriota bacterium]
MHLLDNAIFFMFLSFVVGVLVDPILRRAKPYGSLSSRYLFKTSETYEKLGVLWFRRLLRITPFGSFNPNIRFTTTRDLNTLRSIRSHMATAEMSHWVGFVFMLGMTVVAWWSRGALVGLSYVTLNIVGNLYPCMLQQYNKRRLQHLIEKIEDRFRNDRSPASSG